MSKTIALCAYLNATVEFLQPNCQYKNIASVTTASFDIFIFETLVCLIQIVSRVYFNKRVFLMTPFHHHLEKLGWNERDIVVVFWCIGLLLSMAAILFGVWY